jgi:hypothetical protein
MNLSSPLPAVEIRAPQGSGAYWSVTVDGRPIHKVKSVVVQVDGVSRQPTVTIEMWADVVFIGHADVDLVRVTRVMHCGRPHSDEAAVPASYATSPVSSAPEGSEGRVDEVVTEAVSS